MNDYAKSYLNSDDKYIWVVIGGDKGLCQIAWKNPYGTQIQSKSLSKEQVDKLLKSHDVEEVMIVRNFEFGCPCRYMIQQMIM